MLFSGFPTTIITMVVALKLWWGERNPSWRQYVQPCREVGDSHWRCSERRIILLLPLPPSTALATHCISSCKSNKKQKRQLWRFLQWFIFFLRICEHSPLHRGYEQAEDMASSITWCAHILNAAGWPYLDQCITERATEIQSRFQIFCLDKGNCGSLKWASPRNLSKGQSFAIFNCAGTGTRGEITENQVQNRHKGVLSNTWHNSPQGFVAIGYCRGQKYKWVQKGLVKFMEDRSIGGY